MQNYFTKDIIDETAIIQTIQKSSYPLHKFSDLQPLYDRIGDASIVMLG